MKLRRPPVPDVPSFAAWLASVPGGKMAPGSIRVRQTWAIVEAAPPTVEPLASTSAPPGSAVLALGTASRDNPSASQRREDAA